MLSIEAWLAGRRNYLSAASAPVVEGEFGDPRAAPAATVRLVLLGDSSAAGIGARGVGQTVGGALATRLAGLGYRVRLSNSAISGSRTGDLGPQVSRALLGRPDVAVLLVGTNDALRASPLPPIRRSVGDAVRRLRGAGVEVVVGTCPDLGAARSFAQPLRAVLAARCRQIAAAQAQAVRAAGGVPVDLGALTGTVFRTDPGTLCLDGFHPSGDGYRLWADALLPAVRHAASSRAAL
ncbi:MAG: SGNH/GDSL hydrolase family protein [Actinobacteria bacterium]|nr:SGNH/GDSL hydrolase family protein [Actinomycetota bacterium]MBI3686755.1 SGNH/GDSL hydrolase family protein [Actinomycetota bacterium]